MNADRERRRARGRKWARNRGHQLLCDTVCEGDYVFNKTVGRASEKKPEAEWVPVRVDPTKRYLRQFVSGIRYDGKRVVMRGKKAALIGAAAEKETGTVGVPISSHVWLLDLGSNQGPTD